jgi:NAD(P)-dependent dehydrogenase (short-subunit alcohol dehydrogenase family)
MRLAADVGRADAEQHAVAGAGVKLDAIVCNAGVMALPKLSQAHGYELQFFTNHIGHFMLVTGLIVARGVADGIESVSKILLPLLIVLLSLVHVRGLGPGRVLQNVLAGAKVTGLDSSAYMLEQSQKDTTLASIANEEWQLDSKKTEQVY